MGIGAALSHCKTVLIACYRRAVRHDIPTTESTARNIIEIIMEKYFSFAYKTFEVLCSYLSNKKIYSKQILT